MNANNDLGLKAALEQKRTVVALEMRLQTLRATADSIKLSRQDGLPRANPTGASRVEADVIQIDEAERELEAAQNEWRLTATRLAFKIYDRVKDVRQLQVMLLRYVACLSWRQVIREVGYSDSRVFTLHRLGCKAYRKVGAS